MPFASATFTNSEQMAFVGRQPIFFADLEVYGYELLFRTGKQNAAVVSDGNFATANVVVNALTDIGLDVLTESKRAFVNLTRSLLLNADLSCLPPDGTVLEILEDIEPDDAVLAAIKRLSDSGYTIALDDFIYQPAFEPLVELADIVKIEFPLIPSDELPRHIAKLRSLGVKTILAEKIETQAEFETCKQLGCDLFQGYFFCRPQVINRRRTQSNMASLFQLAALLQLPDVSTGDLAELVRTDPGLSYKVLRFVNSAACGTRKEVESLEHAITLLGRIRLRSLASMILLGSVKGDKPQELIKTAMMRAKLCEILATQNGDRQPERFFTLGMLSVMDAILDLPMHEVLELLPLSSDMNEALLHRTGELSDVLERATAVERVSGDLVHELDAGSAYLEALQWTAQFSMDA